MLSCKASLKKIQSTDIILSLFSDYSAIKLEINFKKKTKLPNIWKLSNKYLNNS